MIGFLQATAPPAFLSLVVAAITAPFVYRMMVRLGAKQNVSAHLPQHQAKQGTPTMGGLSILAAILVAALVWNPEEALMPGLLVLGFFVIGFVDDWVIPRRKPGSRGLGWRVKLLAEIAVATAFFLAAGMRNPIEIGLGVLVILFFANAYNFADGMDALAATLGIALAAGLAVVAYVAGLPGLATLMAILAASYLPFLVYNAPPARIFMGDVASLPVGALLGSAFFSIAHATWPLDGPASSAIWLALALLSLVMVAELVPVPLQIASVKLRGRRMFQFKTPIHHGMQDGGMPETRVVYVLAVAQVACTLGALAVLGFSSRGGAL